MGLAGDAGDEGCVRGLAGGPGPNLSGGGMPALPAKFNQLG